MKNLSTLYTLAARLEAQYAIDHTRIAKAVAIVESQGIQHLPNGNYSVPSSEPNHYYQVNLQHPRCNCLDFAKHNDNPDHICKHLAAAMMWEQLPEAKPAPSPEIQAIFDTLFGQPLSVHSH